MQFSFLLGALHSLIAYRIVRFLYLIHVLQHLGLLKSMPSLSFVFCLGVRQ